MVSRIRKNVFFFFQAEDGIRDLTVTGVQTCALPIWETRVPIEGWREAIGDIRDSWVGGEAQFGRAGKLVGRDASIIDSVSSANGGCVVYSIGEPKTGSPGILGRLLEACFPGTTRPFAGED